LFVNFGVGSKLPTLGDFLAAVQFRATQKREHMLHEVTVASEVSISYSLLLFCFR
jgi:hypothetical protein